MIIGENLDYIPEIMEQLDHDYLSETVDMFALRYVAGFIARHARKYANKCETCEKSLTKGPKDKNEEDILITIKSKKCLTYPSDSLVDLLQSVEETVIKTTLQNEVEENILFVVLEKLENITVRKIGCKLHDLSLTKAVLKFYLITRMHFLTKRWNAMTLEQKRKQKGYRKQAHQT